MPVHGDLNRGAYWSATLIDHVILVHLRLEVRTREISMAQWINCTASIREIIDSRGYANAGQVFGRMLASLSVDHSGPEIMLSHVDLLLVSEVSSGYPCTILQPSLSGLGHMNLAVRLYQLFPQLCFCIFAVRLPCV